MHNLALWRELNASPIRLVGVRHEQTAAYAADGYARASGRLGVALTTTGPGAANTLGAVGEAWASRQPILVIATDIPTSARRPGVWRSTLHEATDQAAMFVPVVKDAVRVHRAEDVGPAVAAAARTALAPPARPVYVEVPTDLLAAEAGPAPRAALPSTCSRAGRPAAPVAAGGRAWSAPSSCSPAPAARWSGPAAARLPVRSGRCGGAAGRAAGGAGDAHLLRARPAARRDTPAWWTRPPHVPEVGALWDEADLVVAVGSDFDAMMTQGWTMPQPPHLVALNVDARDAAKNYRPDLVLEADAAAAAAALAERLPERGGLDALGRRMAALRGRVREDLAADRPRGLRLPGRRRGGAPRRRHPGLRHVHPRLLAGRLSPHAARRASSPTRWAGARSAARSHRRWARRSPARGRR